MLFRQIEYFQAIIETGNFYQAAEKCNVSQSAISQQIKKLEQELGVKLLDRHNRTFSLTPAGEHFYRKSLILVSDIEQIKRETKRIADNDHATLRIGYYKGYHGNELSEAVAEFSSKYPTVDSLLFFKRRPFPRTLPGIRRLGKLVFCRAAPAGAHNSSSISIALFRPQKKRKKRFCTTFSSRFSSFCSLCGWCRPAP